MTQPLPIVDLRRTADARLQVSRLAADLFWRDGVAATRGEDIAHAAGISTRTLWRYFRTKEACAEPVLAASGERFVALLQAWPAHRGLAEHLVTSAAEGSPAAHAEDDLRAMRLIALAEREPELRAAWLLVCDRTERALLPVIAGRLGTSVDDEVTARITAAVGAAVRQVNDRVSIALVAGRDPGTPDRIVADIAAAVHDASHGRLGAPIEGAR